MPNGETAIRTRPIVPGAPAARIVQTASNRPSAPPRRAARSTSNLAFVPKSVLFGLVPLVTIAVVGFPYYKLPLAERLRSPYHPYLRPSGLIGQSAGLLAFALFLFLWLYPLRKRIRKAPFLGPVPRWLDAHIVAGALVPVAAAVHAGFRFTGLIGLGYASMIVVAMSGVIGRYVYVRIPRSRAGLELTREQVSAERRDILGELVESTGLDPSQVIELLKPVPVAERTGILGTLWNLVRDDFHRRRAIARLMRQCGAGSGVRKSRARLHHVASLARREMALAQQIRALDATNRVFRLWHAFHLPFAITAFFAVSIHVAVAVAFGATWFFHP
jgi:hypothetical protein